LYSFILIFSLLHAVVNTSKVNIKIAFLIVLKIENVVFNLIQCHVNFNMC
jgi:hypothetical protein